MTPEAPSRTTEAENGSTGTLPVVTLTRPGWFWMWLWIVVGATALLSLACWTARVHSTVQQGDLMLTTGFEDASVYNVWKARHGDPVYEWPDRGNFCPTFYNFLFYKIYASALDVLGVPNDARGLLAGRLLTSGFALVGVAGQFFLSLRLLRGRAGETRTVSPGGRAFLLTLAGVCWFSTNTTGWGTVTLRPDLAGLSLEIWGMVAWLAAWENYRRAAVPGRAGATLVPLLAAGACFFAAWGVKQSLVWALTGVMLHALASGGGWRWRALGWVAVPVAAGMAACVWGLGPEYRQNTLGVIAAYGYSWRIGVPLLVQTVVTWFPLWWFALPPVLALLRTWRTEGWSAAVSLPGAPVVFALVTAVAFNVFAAFKVGSSGNILLESFFLASALAGPALVELARGSREVNAASSRQGLWPRVQRGIAVASWAVFLVLPAVQLALYFQGRSYTRVAGVTPGGLRKLDRQEEALRRDFAVWLRDSPKPFFLRDGILAQPWHATDQRHPSFIIDFQAYEFMRKRKLMRGDGVVDFIRARHFGSLLVDAGDTEFFPAALAAGYQVRPLPERFSKVPNEYGQPAANMQWLVRTGP